MGSGISKQTKKQRVYLKKVKVPKAWKNVFKKKKRVVVVTDEVDSAVPYSKGHRKTNAFETPVQRSISVETSASGQLEVFVEDDVGCSSIPIDSSEWEKDSMSSFEILDSKQRNECDRRTISSPDSAMYMSYATDSSVDECPLCKAKNTEYMVQVFMPTLQRHLDVKEILPYLHYISHNDARALSITEPQEMAVAQLIETICSIGPHEMGKWTTFLVALDKTGNNYLHQLLTGQTEKDHFFTNEILKLMKPSLINEICLSDVIDHLIEREIINEEDQGHIESVDKSRGPIPAIRIMLEKVDKRHPNWDTEFSDILDKAGMSKIAEVFKMVEHHYHTDTKSGDNLKHKKETRKSFKRKLKKAKRGKCRLHNQAEKFPKDEERNESEPKRKKLNTFPSSYGDGIINEAFTGQNEHFEKGGMTGHTEEVKQVYPSIEEIQDIKRELMSKIDELADILKEHISKSTEVHDLLRQHLLEQIKHH